MFSRRLCCVECLYRPKLHALPMAGTGDVEAHHGIILVKNRLAKQQGLKTDEVICRQNKMSQVNLFTAGLRLSLMI